MMSRARALWDAPPASPGPPRRVWRDWALVGVLAPLAVVEAVIRTDVPWRWLWAAVSVALVPTLLWRRQRPLTMLAIAFATGTAVGLATGAQSQLYTTAYFLLLLYAVFRWGSGRALVLGGALVAAGLALSLVTGTPSAADVIGAVAVAVTTGTLALAFRWRARARSRELDHVRMREREQLARDLHDTVAHHVSAIAIQAQAGSAVVAKDPDATAEVLRAIEREATRTLHEMRSMVGVLRRTGGPELSPIPGLADVRALARTSGTDLEVSVRLIGDAEAVPAPIAAAVFRLAQEAVTNARRHARHATRIDVTVTVDEAGVLLEARDDGVETTPAAPGFGITGMRERAALLGGTVEAGPAGLTRTTDHLVPGAAAGGWAVTASLPRSAWTT